MYIGKANIDLINHKIFEKEYSIKKDERFIARDGILFNEYRAELITILKNVKSRSDADVDGYLELENENNKHFIDVELNGEDIATYESLKLENEKLKSELENKANEEDGNDAEPTVENEGLPTAEVKPNFENSNNEITQVKGKKAKGKK